MNNFEKIQTVILANKARKITISEISRITGIERNSVKNVQSDIESSSGRKCEAPLAAGFSSGWNQNRRRSCMLVGDFHKCT